MKESALKYMQDAGYSPQLVAHIEMQLPDLIQETIKRIKYSPFGNDTAVLNYELNNDFGLKSKLLGYLTTLALEKPLTKICVDTYMLGSPSHLSNAKAVIYSSKTMNDAHDQTPIIVRGHEIPRNMMPLYLERGAHDLAYVYPIFDWSELQILTCAVSVGLISTEEN